MPSVVVAVGSSVVVVLAGCSLVVGPIVVGRLLVGSTPTTANDACPTTCSSSPASHSATTSYSSGSTSGTSKVTSASPSDPSSEPTGAPSKNTV